MNTNEDTVLIKVNLRKDGVVESFHCPICGKKQDGSHQHKEHIIYCWNCGQRIRWGKWKWTNKE